MVVFFSQDQEMVGFRFGGLKNKIEDQKVLKSWFSVPMVSYLVVNVGRGS